MMSKADSDSDNSQTSDTFDFSTLENILDSTTNNNSSTATLQPPNNNVNNSDSLHEAIPSEHRPLWFEIPDTNFIHLQGSEVVYCIDDDNIRSTFLSLQREQQNTERTERTQDNTISQNSQSIHDEIINFENLILQAEHRVATTLYMESNNDPNLSNQLHNEDIPNDDSSSDGLEDLPALIDREDWNSDSSSTSSSNDDKSTVASNEDTLAIAPYEETDIEHPEQCDNLRPHKERMFHLYDELSTSSDETLGNDSSESEENSNQDSSISTLPLSFAYREYVGKQNTAVDVGYQTDISTETSDRHFGIGFSNTNQQVTYEDSSESSYDSDIMPRREIITTIHSSLEPLSIDVESPTSIEIQNLHTISHSLQSDANVARRAPEALRTAIEDDDSIEGQKERQTNVPTVALKPSPSYPYFRRQIQERQNRQELFSWVGDTIEGPHSKRVMRICLQNPNGIVTQAYAKFHQISETMRQNHVNIMGLPESKINPRNYQALLDLQTIHQSYHQCGLIHHTNTKVSQTSVSASQPGGVTTLIDDELSNKYNGVQYDKHGRWVRTSILAQGCALRIYTVYKVNPRPTNCVQSSWHSQAASLAAEGIGTNPEFQVVKDLKEQVEEELKNNNHVMIMADANETISTSSLSLHANLVSLGLINVLQERLSDDLPPTHQRGLAAIDHIWCTPDLFRCILRSGIAPLNYFFQSDHRAIVLDMDISDICLDPLIKLTPHERRRLKSSIVPRAKSYNEFCSNQYESQKIEKRLENLDELLESDETHKEATIMNNAIDQQLCEINLAGEKNLSAIHTVNWSPKYSETLKELEKCRNQLAHYKNQDALLKPSEITHLRQKAYRDLQEARQSHKDNEESAEALRIEHRWELAHEQVSQGRYKTADAAYNSLFHIERQRGIARRVRAAGSTKMHTSLNYVLIPSASEYSPDLQKQYKDPKVIWNRIERQSGKDIQSWESISERKELEELLLGWQCLHFQQAGDTPLATEQWELILTECQTMEEAQKYYQTELDALDPETLLFIEELFLVKPSVDEIIPTVTLDDFKQFIKDKKEKTSTSPSGRHLGHFKAMIEEPIFEAIFKVIQTALYLGEIPDRWKRTVTTLIEKDEGCPKIHRLRTIHIVEPEVQFISKFFWTRAFLTHCEKHGQSHITDAQFGGRRRRQAHSAIVQQLLLWDGARMNNIPMVSHLADARANFDRNMYHVVGTALEKRQFPYAIISWYATFLMNQLFYVRTGYGVSENNYSRTPTNRIYGDCQGLGWSAINQIIISSVIDNAYNKAATPFLIPDHDSSHNITSGVGYFIDDRITNSMIQPSELVSHLLPVAQRNESLQTSLLNAVGGAQAPTKCSVWVLARNCKSLTMTYMTRNALPGTIALRATAKSADIDIRRSDPTQSERYLGAWINPNYTMITQYTKLEENIDSWRTKMMQSTLTTELIHHSFSTTLQPQIEFPLIASDLSYNQCNALMGKIRAVLTSRGHLHSKVKLEITHGPTDLCGLNVPHLYDLQGQLKLRLLRIHAIKAQGGDDSLYNKLQASLSHHCLWLGRFNNFLNTSFKNWGHLLLQRTWIASLWKYLNYRKLTVELAEVPSYILPRVNDRWIMEIIVQSDLPKHDKEVFYRVRIEKEILTLSDITLDDGHTIHPSLLKGQYHFRKSSFSWPRKDNMVHRDWNTRFGEILRDVIQPILGDKPLGRWVSSTHCHPTVHEISHTRFRINDELYERLVTGTIALSVERLTEAERIRFNPCDVKYFGQFGFKPLEHGDIGEKILTRPHPSRTFPRPCVARVSSWMKTLWGKKVKEQDFQLLIIKLQDPFILMSDGGQPGNNGIGTYGYLLATTDGYIFYENYGVVHIAPDQHASMRYEASGTLAGVTLINFVEKMARERGLTLSSDRIYSCDNEQIALIDRNFIPPTNYHQRSHSDIMLQLREELNKSPNSPKELTWVPSHQDKQKKESELTILERLNIRADELCLISYNEAVAASMAPVYKAPFYPAQKISISNESKRFICEKPSEYHLENTLHDLKKYVQKRDNISDEIYQEIAWDTLSGIFKKGLISQKFRIIKIIHEKWLTFDQKHKMDMHPNGICGLCSNEIETPRHVYQCCDTGARNHRNAANNEFYESMLQIHTPEFMAHFFVKALDKQKSWEELIEIFLSQPLPEDRLDILTNAARSQSAIGCENYNKGLISQKWKEIIAEYFMRCNVEKYNEDKWERDFIKLLWKRASSLWEYRNKQCIEDEESYLSNLQNKATKDLAYYKKNQALLGQYRFLINHSSKYFTRASLATLLHWNKQLDEAVKNTAEFAMTRQTLITQHFGTDQQKRRSKKRKRVIHTPVRRVHPRRTEAYFRSPTLDSFFSPIPQPRPPPAPDPCPQETTDTVESNQEGLEKPAAAEPNPTDLSALD